MKVSVPFTMPSSKLGFLQWVDPMMCRHDVRVSVQEIIPSINLSEGGRLTREEGAARRT